MFLVAGGSQDARFLADQGSNVTVNGAVVLVTDYTQSTPRAQLEVRDSFTVNGVIMELSPNHETNFTKDSTVRITGSYDLGPALDPLLNLSTLLTLESSIVISKDTLGIQTGATALSGLAQAIGKPSLSSYLTKSSMTTLCWYKP